MNFLKHLVANLRNVERHVLYLVGVLFFLELIEGSFFILFNFYLKSLAYTDVQIAQLTSYRFLAIMLLAFPLGLYIKGRKLKPFLQFASVAMPLIAFAVLWVLSKGWFDTASLLMVAFGVTSICLSVTAMPFVILNSPERQHPEAIALFFQVHSLTAFLSGIINYILQQVAPDIFDEKTVMQMIALLGLVSIWFVSKITIKEHVSARVPLSQLYHAYDWRKIGEVVTPMFMIAVGAGLTIPFINLFFQNVHGMDSKDFSLWGSISFILVTLLISFVPIIRRRYGFKMVITMFQSLAVVALVIMATTEFYAYWKYAGIIAVVAYLLRQPLMNVAGPATSELNLSYLGERNREMISALGASIWSGSWFVSSKIFGSLRAADVSYAHIFMITAALYVVAIIWYVRLIHRVEDQQAEEKAALCDAAA